MPTPRKGYFLADGSKVGGVTTYISQHLGWGKEALMRWAAKEAGAGRDFGETRDTAARIGTLAHAMAEAHLRKLPTEVPPDTPPEISKPALRAFASFREWERWRDYQVIASEIHLVSERYRYGGTPDAVLAAPDGRLYLLDWKTSNGIYGSHRIQVAAYWHLLDECRPDLVLEPEAIILRFDKRGEGEFERHVVSAAQIAAGWRAFLALIELSETKHLLEPAA